MQLDELFHLENQDLRSYSPLTLAYIGDGIYELIIRTVLVRKGNCPVNQLHKKASSLVKADYRRATGFEALMGYLYLKGDYTRMLELVRMGIGEDRL